MTMRLRLQRVTERNLAWAQVMLLIGFCEGPQPRFFQHGQNRYSRALLLGDLSRIEAARNDLLVLAGKSDVLVRQLLEHALKHYKLALSQGNDPAITLMWNEVFQISLHARSIPNRLRRTLSFLRYPAISKLAFAFRRIGRPAMLWVFRTRPLEPDA